MKRRGIAVIAAMLMAVAGFALTGCGDDDTTSADNAEIANYAVEIEQEESEGCGVLTATDEAGNTVWEFTTDSFPMTELTISAAEIGVRNGGYYFEAGGTIYCVDAATGEELWSAPGAGGVTGWDFDEDGTLYCCGYYGPDLMVVDGSGNIKNTYEKITLDNSTTMDEGYYWPVEVHYTDGSVVITYESNNGSVEVDPATGAGQVK